MLERRTGLPLELWDERMSTARALAAIREQGGSTRGRKADVDALAAAVLLQHFLDARRNRSEREKAERTENVGMKRTIIRWVPARVLLSVFAMLSVSRLRRLPEAGPRNPPGRRLVLGCN